MNRAAAQVKKTIALQKMLIGMHNQRAIIRKSRADRVGPAILLMPCGTGRSATRSALSTNRDRQRHAKHAIGARPVPPCCRYHGSGRKETPSRDGHAPPTHVDVPARALTGLPMREEPPAIDSQAAETRVPASQPGARQPGRIMSAAGCRCSSIWRAPAEAVAAPVHPIER